jgi:multidrug efflux pump subunit AcrB
MDSREAIFHAAMTRFRPIMMTTTAALLGLCRFVSASAKGANCANRLASRSSAA